MVGLAPYRVQAGVNKEYSPMELDSVHSRGKRKRLKREISQYSVKKSKLDVTSHSTYKSADNEELVNKYRAQMERTIF